MEVIRSKRSSPCQVIVNSIPHYPTAKPCAGGVCPRNSESKVATIHAWELKKVLYMGFVSMIPFQVYANGLTLQRYPMREPLVLGLADLCVPVC